MMIVVNMNIVVMILDSMHVYNFHGQTVVEVKMLFLELTEIFLCMLIIKKDILVLDEDQTQGLDDTTITAEAKYCINFTRPKATTKAAVSYLLMPKNISVQSKRFRNKTISITFT